jgi:esterase/lipase superfamily enzyme
MMPAPDVYDERTVDPFILTGFVNEPPNFPLLYATDRRPLAEGEVQDGHRFYGNERGHLLRVGEATIQVGQGGYTWEEARRVSLLKDRDADYPLQVRDVEEFGVVSQSLTAWFDPEGFDRAPEERFIKAVNDRMALTKSKDVFVYVHGYKVNFENPILVASELWHFLGYKGAFVAYSWPSTPKTLAYVSDLEDATNAARNFREFLMMIADKSEVERIHVIGYSAGTRMVTRAIADLALMGRLDYTREQKTARTKLHNVVLVGSDVDAQLFAGYLADGWFSVMDRFTVYMSGGDAALGMSRRVFGKNRVGQMFEDPANLPRNFVEYLEERPNFMVIDVTDAAGSMSGNGHAYFRSSPWVSSDILMNLYFDLNPAERGLVQRDDSPVWTFPENYIQGLTEALAKKGVTLSDLTE